MRRALRLAFADGADAPMSPAAIAASVPKSDELLKAEQTAAALHAEREQNLARVAELEPLLDDPIERRDAAREFRDLILRRRVIEPEISAIRADLIRCGASRGEGCRRALSIRTRSSRGHSGCPGRTPHQRRAANRSPHGDYASRRQNGTSVPSLRTYGRHRTNRAHHTGAEPMSTTRPRVSEDIRADRSLIRSAPAKAPPATISGAERKRELERIDSAFLGESTAAEPEGFRHATSAIAGSS